tara:strand:- start:161 stop:562 length:402 start_codon:yes stop_codon:yes gene_type:complete
MQIRALTGFSESTIKNYGRSYSPLNGYNKTILGAIGAGPYQNDTETLPTSIPPQTITVKDKKTGETKSFKVENIRQVIQILFQGFQLLSSLRGGSGQQVINIPTPAPEKKGLSTEVLIGLGAVAVIFLMMNRK